MLIQKPEKVKIEEKKDNLFSGEDIVTKLTTKKRNALPKSEFAGADRSYPVNDKSHARNAKARASEMENKGKISKSTEEKIDAKADKVLGKKKKKK